MAVKVENVTQAKTGKSLRVMLSGSWYGAALDSGLNGQIGRMIEAEIETGKYGPWIKKWTLSQVAAPQVPPPATPPAAAPGQGQPAAAAPSYVEPASVAEQHFREACIFMSGAVNHAIGAGKVGGPTEVRAWASASLIAFYEALDDLKKCRE